MLIGLMRHYDIGAVPGAFPALLSAEDFRAYVRAFDTTRAALPHAQPDTGRLFACCISSDLPRALDTARHVFPGPIATDPRLRELPIAPCTTLPVKLPLSLWLLLGRLAWVAGLKTQPIAKAEFASTVRSVADRIANSGHSSVLVVSHGITLHSLRKELTRRGFSASGPVRRSRGSMTLLSNASWRQE